MPARLRSLAAALPTLLRPTLLVRALGGAVLALSAACALDTPTAPHAARPITVSPLVASGTRYMQVSAGGYQTCAVTADRTATCWGWGTVPDSLAGRVAQVSAGDHDACALTTAGSVACWGLSLDGEANVPSDLRVAGATQVSAGAYMTCILTSPSDPYGNPRCRGHWGLGVILPPKYVPGATQVSAGYDHACAVTTARTVTCWGYNVDGEATPPDSLAGRVTQVSAGQFHTCAVTTAGTVACWGDDTWGRATPPADLAGVTQVSAGYQHACALTTAGTVRCWGDNSNGQTSVPADLVGVTQVSAGGYHTCALTTAGAIRCWGDNSSGQTSVPGTTTHVYPTATFTATPDSVVVGQPVTLALTHAQVPGHPEATTFTYAFDCGTGTFGARTSNNSTTCTTSTAGPLTVRGEVVDRDQDTASYAAAVTVLTPAQATQRLRGVVATSGISADVRQGLTDKLDAALAALARGQTTPALRQLAAFQLQVQAQRGNAIPVATADAWLAQVTAIRQALGG